LVMVAMLPSNRVNDGRRADPHAFPV